MESESALRARLAAAGLLMLALAGCGGSGDESTAARTAQPAADAGVRRQALATTTATTTSRPVGTTALLDWAERNFPQYFPGHQDDQSVSPYTYRYYPQTGNYVGVANGRAAIYGPISGGALADVGAVSDFRCQVYAWECQPNPLLTAKWQAGVALETGDETPQLSGLGIDDQGRATVLIRKERNGTTRLFASQTLLPDSSGVIGWSVEQPLDVAGEFREPMSPLTSGELHVAANGKVVVVWGSRGPCLPGTSGYGHKYSDCNYVMANRYDPTTGQWSGAVRVAEAYATYSFEASQIDNNGNFGVLVQLPEKSDYQLWIWNVADPKPMAVPVPLPNQALLSKRLAIRGRQLYVAGTILRNGKYDVVAYRGTVDSGFGSEELLEKQFLQATVHRVLVSPQGGAIVNWSGYKLGGDTLTFAYAPTPTAPFVAVDPRQSVFTTLVANGLNASFNDAGELILPVAGPVDCQFWRLVDGVWQRGSRWSADDSLCAGYLPVANRNGDQIGTNSKGWFVVDARTESASQPSSMMRMIEGTSHIRPGTGQAVLSVNGTAVYVAVTSYDVLPTHAQPNGNGRAQVRNLWGWVLR